MSMLAERKTKQRWLLNPRGKQWAEDSNGFGQKLLQKMGWKHGKGLGANEDGITESLKVAYKNDCKGMGYKDEEKWTAHDDNFSTLLKNLNGNVEKSDNVKVSSLEAKSQNCRTRIHYHKFTKGKDISRYSEKDLASILGKKTLKQNDKSEAHKVKKECKVDIEDKNETLVNKGSMADYFKKKLPNFAKYKLNHPIGNNQNKSDSETERVGFGFVPTKQRDPEEKFKLNNRVSMTGRPDSESENEKVGFGFALQKQKGMEMSVSLNGLMTDKSNFANERAEIGFVLQKQRDVEGKFVPPLNGSSKTNEDAEQNCNETLEPKQKKKHKKKKEKGFTSYLSEEIEIIPEQNDTEDYILVDGIKTKKKKRKCNSLNDDKRSDEISIEQNTNKFTKSKKLKKFKIENCTIEENAQNVGSIEDLKENISDNGKRRKKKKFAADPVEETIMGSNNEIFKNTAQKPDDNRSAHSIEDLNDGNDIAGKMTSYHDKSADRIEDIGKEHKKQKKLKKKKEENNSGISNPAFSDFNISSDNNSPQVEQNMDTTVRKKKKKRKNETTNCEIESASLNISEDSVTGTPLNPYEIKIKKRKYECINEGIENPSFDPSANSINDASSNLYEVKTKKKKKYDKTEIGTDNPALNLSDIVTDTDLMLNIVDTPVTIKKNIEKFDINISMEKVKSAKKKSVRFSDILQERIIPNDPAERTNEYISKRNELFDINTMVVEESVKKELEKQGLPYENGYSPSNFSDCDNLSKIIVASSVKEELNRGLNSQGFINNGFDIRIVDKINFYEHKYEVEPSNNKGIDNKGFNKLKNHIEENVETMSNTIERFQAEVENDINESKANANSNSSNSDKIHNWLVGDVGSQIRRSIKVKEGSKLCFKDMHFTTQVPSYLKGNVSRSRKSYRHLIRGDITVAFKNSNLHDIKGYAVHPEVRIRTS